MKYRVVKEGNRFFPERRVGFETLKIWMRYKNGEGKYYSFSSFDIAKQFIQDKIEERKPKQREVVYEIEG